MQAYHHCIVKEMHGVMLVIALFQSTEQNQCKQDACIISLDTIWF